MVFTGSLTVKKGADSSFNLEHATERESGDDESHDYLISENEGQENDGDKEDSSSEDENMILPLADLLKYDSNKEERQASRQDSNKEEEEPTKVEAHHKEHFIYLMFTEDEDDTDNKETTDGKYKEDDTPLQNYLHLLVSTDNQEDTVTTEKNMDDIDDYINIVSDDESEKEKVANKTTRENCITLSSDEEEEESDNETHDSDKESSNDERENTGEEVEQKEEQEEAAANKYFIPLIYKKTKYGVKASMVESSIMTTANSTILYSS